MREDCKRQLPLCCTRASQNVENYCSLIIELITDVGTRPGYKERKDGGKKRIGKRKKRWKAKKRPKYSFCCPWTTNTAPGKAKFFLRRQSPCEGGDVFGELPKARFWIDFEDGDLGSRSGWKNARDLVQEIKWVSLRKAKYF